MRKYHKKVCEKEVKVCRGGYERYANIAGGHKGYANIAGGYETRPYRPNPVSIHNYCLLNPERATGTSDCYIVNPEDAAGTSNCYVVNPEDADETSDCDLGNP